ncbi:MAG: hypothetical protein HGA87_00160 [Desulfobulbaceae bacterium]|nr:hypothetical protein [Desulfobulbaceae bacterium]
MLSYDKQQSAYFGKLLDRPIDGRVDVEIGDSKQPDFKPQAKLVRHGNRANLSFRYAGAIAVSRRIEQDRVVTAERDGVAVELYDKPEQEAFELELVLSAIPATNRFPFTVRSKGVTDWFYQPELTEEEIAEGCERPENVVGSYALYGEDGKLFHLYRPHIVDAAGNACWGALELDLPGDLVTVVVPHEFLERAVYPVRVDPTIGYTSVGASSRILLQGDLGFVSQFTSVSATAATFYLYCGSYAGINIKGVVYDDDGTGGYPQTLLGVTGEISVPSGWAYTWVSGTINCGLPGSGNVWIGGITGSSDSFRYKYDTGGSAKEKGPLSYDEPDDFPTGSSNYGYMISTYVAYVEVIECSADITGSGSVAVSPVTINTVSAAITGSGAVSVAITDVNTLSAAITGSGSYTVEAVEVQAVSVAIAGSGVVDAAVEYGEDNYVFAEVSGGSTVSVVIIDVDTLDITFSGQASLFVDAIEIDSFSAEVIGGSGTVSVAIVFADIIAADVLGSGAVSVSVAIVFPFVVEIDGGGHVAVAVDGGDDIEPWQPPTPDTSTPAQKASRVSRASAVTKEIVSTNEVIAPLAQQITDASTGLPTKPMADFMFQVGQKLSSLKSKVEEVSETVSEEIITIGPIVDDIENLKKLIDDLIATAYEQGAKIQEFTYVYQSDTLSIAQKVEQLTASVASAAAAIRHEQSVRAEENYAMAMDRRILVANVRDAETEITKTQASLVEEQLVRATADSAMASDILALEATVNTIDGEVAGHSSAISSLTASVDTINNLHPYNWTGEVTWPRLTTIANAAAWSFNSDEPGPAMLEVLAYDAEGDGVQIAFNGATLSPEMSGGNMVDVWHTWPVTLVDGANTVKVWAPDSDVGSIKAVRVYRTASIVATAESLLELDSQVNNPSTGLPNAHARITGEASTRASADSALASSINTLSTTVGGHTTTLTEHASSIDGIEGRWGVSINASGHVTAIQLIGSESSSQFIIDADVIINGSLTTEKIEDNAVTVPQIYGLTSNSYGVDETFTVTVSVACPVYISASFTLPDDNLSGNIASTFIVYVNSTNIFQEKSYSGNVRSFNINNMLSAGSNTVRFIIRRENSAAYGSGYLPRNIFFNLLAAQK